MNVLASLTLPRAEKKQMQPLTEEEEARLAKACDDQQRKSCRRLGAAGPRLHWHDGGTGGKDNTAIGRSSRPTALSGSLAPADRRRKVGFHLRHRHGPAEAGRRGGGETIGGCGIPYGRRIKPEREGRQAAFAVDREPRLAGKRSRRLWRGRSQEQGNRLALLGGGTHFGKVV